MISQIQENNFVVKKELFDVVLEKGLKKSDFEICIFVDLFMPKHTTLHTDYNSKSEKA